MAEVDRKFLQKAQKVVKICKELGLNLMNHKTNYILGSSICVLSHNTYDIGMPLIVLETGRGASLPERWYLSPSDCEKYQNYIKESVE